MPLDTCCHCQFVIRERLRMFVASRCLSPMPACHRLMHVSSPCLSPPHICHHRTLYHWCISAQDICCCWTILTCHFTEPRKFFGTVGIARDLNRGPQDLQPGALPTEPPQPQLSHHNPTEPPQLKHFRSDHFFLNTANPITFF